MNEGWVIRRCPSTKGAGHFLCGKSLRSPTEWQQNITYLANSGRVDGLIIATGGIGNFCSPQVRNYAGTSPYPWSGSALSFEFLQSARRTGEECVTYYLICSRSHGYGESPLSPGRRQPGSRRTAGRLL